MKDVHAFLATYDRPGVVVLLEGKRMVKSEDEKKLYALAKQLAHHSKYILFRSGNASGSDQFFSAGVAAVDPKRLQAIIPYSGHRSYHSLAGESIALDQLSIAEEEELIRLTRTNRNRSGLVDMYLKEGGKGKGIKAAYLLRDTMKVIGFGAIKAADVAIFYDDLQNPVQGGTGHTMQVCHKKQIPYMDQRTWMTWLN